MIDLDLQQDGLRVKDLVNGFALGIVGLFVFTVVLAVAVGLLVIDWIRGR